MKMTRLLLTAVLCLSFYTVFAQKMDWDKEVVAIEETYAQTPQPHTLHKNEGFKQQMKAVIARGDASSVYLINKYSTFIYMNGMTADVKNALAKMSKELKTSKEGVEVQNMYYQMRKLEVGSQVPDFTLFTPEGKEVNLYSFIKGKKCVILDFWASWCGWCRKESPNVQKVYDAYKGKDFDVISVSFDDKRDRWVKAIEEDKTTWMQVSDLKGTKSPVYGWYDLNGIPAIFLIDGNGRILVEDMRGEVIVNSVKNVLGK